MPKRPKLPLCSACNKPFAPEFFRGRPTKRCTKCRQLATSARVYSRTSEAIAANSPLPKLKLNFVQRLTIIPVPRRSFEEMKEISLLPAAAIRLGELRL